VSVVYYIRHFNADGGVLRFAMVHCANDSEAVRKAANEPAPPGCTSVEVTREQTPIWRAEAAELWLTTPQDSRAVAQTLASSGGK
jgi:hypothetical protein